METISNIIITCVVNVLIKIRKGVIKSVTFRHELIRSMNHGNNCSSRVFHGFTVHARAFAWPTFARENHDLEKAGDIG